MSLTRKQLSYLQQALWKIETAKALVAVALDGTDVGSDYAVQFDELMDELTADLAENTAFVD